MLKLRALDRKLLRDLGQMRGQAIAIAFVVAAGVASWVSMASIMDSLQGTLAAYYRDYRFADGFATVRRAPERVADRLRAVAGIGHVETRVIGAANLDVRGFDEPVTSVIVSLPGAGQPALNRLVIRSGQLPAARSDEVLLNEVFADAHDLEPGDSITAILNGRYRVLTVSGIALSPEYLMQIQPGAFFPDPERFGVLWMDRDVLAPAYDMDGAFNDVVFTIAPGARTADVIERVDAVLRQYGGQGAHGREDQPSHSLISEEFRQLETMSTLLPAIFLAVAAFLLNIVVSRLVALQREQIAVLKAFGYTNVAIGVHYLKLVLVIGLLGALLGIALGIWAGAAMGGLYLEFYRFPALDYTLRASVVVLAVSFTGGAALLGVIRAVRNAVRLAPAEAMRPPAPATYRPTIVERLGLQRFFDQPTRMIMRNLERQSIKSLLTVLGIAAGCALLVMGLFFGDAFDRIIRVQYGIAQRHDLAVTFIEPTSSSAVQELAALPGVLHAEPMRTVPVRLRHGHREEMIALQGVPPDAYLQRVIDPDLRPLAIPPSGVLLSTRLGELLDARAGDQLEVEVLEGTRSRTLLTVAGLGEQFVGLGAYMELDELNRLAGNGQAVSGALLMIDDAYANAITGRLQDRPRIAAITAQDQAINAVRTTFESSMLVMTAVLSLFAGIIAFGVIYNSARISLSERDRELASLRVLGFRRGEVAYILLGELALLVLLAVPVGFLFGGLGARALVDRLQSDMYQIPLVLQSDTFAIAASVVLGAGAASALIVLRRLNELDLVGVLKTRE
ncbi:MAG TPA: ABC transporter permease [Longimicrobiales bacterium]|nr:ABC transporter permease [Longimicrobiales bacterium]